MAGFSDLPFELQTEIFMLALPPRGGVHWVELEGRPLPYDDVRKGLHHARELFDPKPQPGHLLHAHVMGKDYGYQAHTDWKEEHGDRSTTFFQHVYYTVPSVWGQSKGPAQIGLEDELAPEIVDEILDTRRCRQLSTYTQVAALLSTCRSSRWSALTYLIKMEPNLAVGVRRGTGPLSRPRPLRTWQRQYEHLEQSPKGITVGNNIVPTICPTLDLVVLRLHTSSGYPTPTLQDAWQLQPESLAHAYFNSVPVFPRMGFEYRPLWSTSEGREEFCDQAIRTIISLSGIKCQLSTQLYWLVDGIPRPRWDQYHPAIPATFNRLIEDAQGRIFRNCTIRHDKKRMARLLEHHNLHQEFEANGRRYYVVFVVTRWRSEYYVDQSSLDPAVDWDGLFPGGEAIWPVPLHEPVRLAYDINEHTATNRPCTTILSWEPI